MNSIAQNLHTAITTLYTVIGIHLACYAYKTTKNPILPLITKKNGQIKATQRAKQKKQEQTYPRAQSFGILLRIRGNTRRTAQVPYRVSLERPDESGSIVV